MSVENKKTAVIAEQENSVLVFPTEKDAEGFFFETEAEKELGISTIVYDNGNVTKKATLSNGSVAVVRTTFGRDNKEILRRINGDGEDYINGQISVATTIDGKPALFEDIQSMKSKDINKLAVCNQALNF